MSEKVYEQFPYIKAIFHDYVPNSEIVALEETTSSRLYQNGKRQVTILADEPKDKVLTFHAIQFDEYGEKPVYFPPYPYEDTADPDIIHYVDTDKNELIEEAERKLDYLKNEAKQETIELQVLTPSDDFIDIDAFPQNVSCVIHGDKEDFDLNITIHSDRCVSLLVTDEKGFRVYQDASMMVQNDWMIPIGHKLYIIDKDVRPLQDILKDNIDSMIFNHLMKHVDTKKKRQAVIDQLSDLVKSNAIEDSFSTELFKKSGVLTINEKNPDLLAKEYYRAMAGALDMDKTQMTDVVSSVKKQYKDFVKAQKSNEEALKMI